MKNDQYLGMRSGDLDDKPYARFWQPEMKPLQPQVAIAALHGAEASELGLSLVDADQLLTPGYLSLENGITQLADGHTVVAVLTELPGVTGEMFEWWMGWHTMEAQRYKLWHPRAHVDNGTREMQGDNPDLADREKYLTTHYVTEYIGDRLESIRIKFVDPTVFLGRTVDYGANGVSAMVCAEVSLQAAPITIARLVHQIRQVPGGSEMRSRFWLGKPEVANRGKRSLRNRLLSTDWLRKRLVPPDLGYSMLIHCGMEMNHLAGFLPDLYHLYHDDSH